jgi:lipoate-protein ligase A
MARIAGEGCPSESVSVPIDVGIRCAENVRADEELLRTAVVGARVAVLGDITVSVGVGVAPSEAYLGRARTAGCPVVRRTTGGSGLLHAPGDLAWTVVLPRQDPRVGPSYVNAYPRLGTGVMRFLETAGVHARWIPASGVSSSYCTLSPRGYVLTVGDHVLGGAAQHVTQNALLHHGILPRTLDRPLIGRIFDLPITGGVGRLTCLEDLGLRERAERQAEALARALAEQLENKGS